MSCHHWNCLRGDLELTYGGTHPLCWPGPSEHTAILVSRAYHHCERTVHCESLITCPEFEGAGRCVRVGHRRSIHWQQEPGPASTAHARTGATRGFAHPPSSAEDADASEVTRSHSFHGKHRLLVVNPFLVTGWSWLAYLGTIDLSVLYPCDNCTLQAV